VSATRSRPSLARAAAIAALCAVGAGSAAVVPLGAGRAAAAPSCSITATLRPGVRSTDVTCLESVLIYLGYRLTGPDTTYGSDTVAAVKSFQRSHRLVADGIVGPKTRAALGIAPASTLPTPPPLVNPVPPKVLETRVIGHSVEGRPITAYRMGTPGGKVVVVIGVIHGDEDKGARITQLLRSTPTSAGIDLWLIDSINPDGQAHGTRENANGVDLNRNFEHGWHFIPKDGKNHQYSGEKPGDQPETKAVEAFVRQVQPKVTMWYHQDANTLSVNGADKKVPTALGQWTGLVPRNVPCSAGCTGTASGWVNATVSGSTSFIVELPGSAAVDSAMVQRHATALLAAILL
jgi:protein MpaA